MTKTEKARDERTGDLIANLAVATICGLLGSGLAVSALIQRGHANLPLWIYVVAGIGGFVLGSAYGLWHAIVGWKSNDMQILQDDEFHFMK